jgi:hypothetical protein
MKLLLKRGAVFCRLIAGTQLQLVIVTNASLLDRSKTIGSFGLPKGHPTSSAAHSSLVFVKREQATESIIPEAEE